ncbi:hypothetical protein HanRHA438_Chr13g0583311 [Helianthus annuus]|nr:hypothetical protein HanRHA438_Chr13g0583311 [Helianthus annuus]
MTPKTTEQNDDSVEMIQHPANHVNSNFESCLTSYDNTFLPSSSTTSADQEVNFGDDYYDTGSPGTVDELQCFWQQLYSENMDSGNNVIDPDLPNEDCF